MSKNYDEEINQKELELKLVKSQMEAVRLLFIKHSTNFVENFYREKSNSFIRTKADVTLNLEKEKLGNMKEKIDKLIKDVKEITSEDLSSEELWFNARDRSLFTYYYSGNAPPLILDKAIRHILGKLCVILDEYGYLNHDHRWLEYKSSGNYLPSKARPYYPYFFVWSDEMKNTIFEYNELYKQARTLRKEINNLIDEKKMDEAKRLWDSIKIYIDKKEEEKKLARRFKIWTSFFVVGAFFVLIIFFILFIVLGFNFPL